MKNQPSETVADLSVHHHQTAALMMDNIPHAVLLIDDRLNVLAFNHNAKEEVASKFGITLRYGMPAMLLVSGKRQPAMKSLVAEVLQGRVQTIETGSPLLKERKEIYEHTFSPARNTSGEIIGLLVQCVNITKRKMAGQSIQDAEERWQFAFEASNQAAWDWNMQTDEVIYSSSYKKMYGFLSDELGNDVSEWQNRIHPEDRKRIEKAVEEHSRSENPYYETTYRIQLKNGDYKWIMARGKLLTKDGEGRPLRMIGTHTDLTETLKDKEEIRKMNERFYYAAQASSQALWEWDPLTGEAYVSSSFTRMFGWQVDDNRYFEQWHHYIHPDDRKATIDDYYNTLYKTQETIWQATYRFLKADGTYAVVSDKAYILRNPEKKVIKVIGATQDVTALKKAEEELLRSNERYNMVLKATNELLWEWNITAGEVYRAKENIGRVYGLPDDSFVKTAAQWYQRIHPGDIKQVKQCFRNALAGEHMQTFELEYRFRRLDGEYNDIYGRGILLKDETGQAVRMIGSEQNISERKQLERELLRNELETKKRINQATVDSQEHERSEIGSELHDNINQVLTTTRLYLELAMANKEMQEELLKKSCTNIGNVINEIRLLSRSLMDPTIGDLGIVESINDLVENINLTKKLYINLQVSNAIEHLLDKKQKLTIFRIIQECLNNVIKHAKATFVVICIQPTNQELQVEITDDGVGFSPESVKKGAGLKNITNRVYLINGQLRIESQPGKGCRLYINFPVTTKV